MTIKVGDTVARMDGTPRPPKHHTRKVRNWRNNNWTGVIKEVHSDYYVVTNDYHLDSGMLIISMIVNRDSVQPIDDSQRIYA